MFSKSSSPADPLVDSGAEPLFRSRPEIHTPGRRRSPEPEAASTPAETAANPSTLGKILRFEGAVTGEGDLVLDGCVKGDIRVARLMVGPSAVVEGTIVAQLVEVRGRVLGSIEAQVVRLHATAHVEGDIRHGRLSVEETAHFEGRCQPMRTPEAPTAVQPAAKPAKPDSVTPFPSSGEAREAPARPAAVTAG